MTMIIPSIDIARPNRFAIIITPPSAISPVILRESNVESVSMPGLSVSTLDYDLDNYPTFKVPYRRVPEGTVSISVRLEENGKTRLELKKWMDLVVGQQGGRYFSKYLNEVVGSIVIHQLDLQGKKTFGVLLSGAYPVNMDSVAYDWGDTNSYVKQTISFSYFDESSF